MKVKQVSVFLLSIGLVVLAACSAGNAMEVKHLEGVSEHFEDEGMTYENETEQYYQMIGAEGGVGVDIDGVSVEIYEFSEDSKELKAAKESGKIAGIDANFNSNLVMIVHSNGGEKVVSAFKQY